MHRVIKACAVRGEERGQLRRQSDHAVGYDLKAAQGLHVGRWETVMVPTGVILELPADMEAQVRPRSGLSRRGVLVHFGTVDPDYRGEVGVLLTNLSPGPFHIETGTRVAQLVFSRVESPEIWWVPEDELGETGRGSGGFGSTGL